MDKASINVVKSQSEREKACDHCYCRKPRMWMGTGPAPSKCCKCGHEKVITHGKTY